MVDLVIEVIDARIPVSSRNPIIDDLVNNRAEFIINKCDESLSQMMIEDVGTDTEITYKLDDYELWFPFNYHYINNEYKLTNQQFGWEFCLEN